MKKILVIDDDENIRNIFGRALTENNYLVIQAENGAIGEQVFKEENPDLIILDIIMPEQEGIETLLNIRNINPDIKIIAVSGGGMGSAFSYLDNAIKLGASAAFQKPIDLQKLINKVELLLQ